MYFFFFAVLIEREMKFRKLKAEKHPQLYKMWLHLTIPVLEFLNIHREM